MLPPSEFRDLGVLTDLGAMSFTIRHYYYLRACGPAKITPQAPPPPLWLGVDVGAERKGFDVAVIDERSLVELRARLTVSDVVELADTHVPLLTAIDSPRSCAPPGHTSRADERALSRAVCGIRWTPRLLRLDPPRPGAVQRARNPRA
jgi:hypothetical protein